MNNHRQAVNIGQRLAGQPGRGHPGGDDDDGILVFDHGLRLGRGKLDRPVLYVLRRARETISFRPDIRGARGSQIGAFMNSFEFNKIAGAVLATALMVFGLKSLAGVILPLGHAGKARLCH